MPALATTGSMLSCPHGGRVLASPVNPRARAASGVVLCAADDFAIVGCPFSPGSPHPCKSVRWVMPARRVRQHGDPVLNADSIGLCLAADNAIQGLVQISPLQAAVRGL